MRVLVPLMVLRLPCRTKFRVFIGVVKNRDSLIGRLPKAIATKVALREGSARDNAVCHVHTLARKTDCQKCNYIKWRGFLHIYATAGGVCAKSLGAGPRPFGWRKVRENSPQSRQ